MARHIYAKRIRGKVYFYLQETFRQKIDPNHSGTTRGSGKSKVVTKSIYLGTEQQLIQRLNQTPDEPLEVYQREFGFVAAIYQVAKKIGIVSLLQEKIQGKRFGIPCWLYFFLAIVNRLCAASSKAKMGDWAKKTILPELLSFDPKDLNSQTFWYATDGDCSKDSEYDKEKEDVPEFRHCNMLHFDSRFHGHSGFLTVGGQSLAHVLSGAGIDSGDNSKRARRANFKYPRSMATTERLRDLLGKYFSRFGRVSLFGYSGIRIAE